MLIFILQIQNSLSSEMMPIMAQLPKQDTKKSAVPAESDLWHKQG